MVSVTPEQLATVQVPLARPRVCFPRPPPRLYGLLAHRRTAARRQSSSKEAQELGTLRPTLVPAFRFFSLAPNRLLDWAGTHSDVLVIEWLPILRSANPHAAYLQRRRSFRSLSSYLPWHPTRRRITYSRYNTSTIKLVAALGFRLEPLPPSHCLPLRPWTLRRRCVLHLS